MQPAANEELFNRIKVWRRSGEKAPHKPLLLLYALGRYQNGADRLLPYKEVDRDLRLLLQKFGPERRSHHPEYPFWRLQNDHLWEVADAHRFELRKGSSDAKHSALLEHDARGGLTKPLYDAVCADPALRARIVEALLETHFEP